MNFEIKNHFPFPVKQVVDSILDIDFQEELHEELGYNRWEEEQSVKDENGQLLRILAVTPNIDLPGFIRSALGNSTGYHEYQVWEDDLFSYAWEAEFEISKRVKLLGTCEFEATEDSACTRTISAECSVNIPVIGGQIANYFREQTTRTQNEAAKAMIAHLKRL